MTTEAGKSCRAKRLNRLRNLCRRHRSTECSENERSLAWKYLRSSIQIDALCPDLHATAKGIVAITVSSDPDGVIFNIVDNGPGIPKDKISAVFEPFLQADGGFSRRHEGAGLGLPIAKELADAHGGTLEIESASGSGTTVTLRLPLRPDFKRGNLLLKSIRPAGSTS